MKISKNIDGNLLMLERRLKQIKNRIRIIEEIKSSPHLRKRDLIFHLKAAQEELTSATFSFIYNEIEGIKDEN